MNILINASNLKQGGGVQVAQSIIAQLERFPQHHFVVVVSDFVKELAPHVASNITVYRYTIKKTLLSTFLGRDCFLDRLVSEKHINVVLTVFGPSRWRPHVPHLCGFARAQLVLTDSPYYKRFSFKEKVICKIWTWLFKKSSNTFYTENAYISKMLPDLLGNVQVYTVSNYYNQVFDIPSLWRKHPLPSFNGCTCLSISSFYPHKNFNILVGVAQALRTKYPDFRFRFVLTFDEGKMDIPEKLRQHFVFIGKVDVDECPDLYCQSNVMVMPTLMECFTATYPEAMRMEVPIVTTDLEFARILCEDAACYYSAMDAEACADAVYRVATDLAYTARLVAKGKQQLQKFDNYEQRADKLIGILEEMTK